MERNGKAAQVLAWRFWRVTVWQGRLGTVSSGKAVKAGYGQARLGTVGLGGSGSVG